MDTENRTLTAWEKMQRDMIYDDFDEDLFNRRVAAKTLFKRYNKTDDSQTEERRELMEALFGSVGKNVYVEPTFTCEFGKNIFIGNDVYLNFGAVLLDCSRITIGEGAVIGCGSIVTHDIPPRTLAAGNPCRVIRPITEADKVGFVK